ncbi:hypothetical protein [Rubritalea tangerina]
MAKMKHHYAFKCWNDDCKMRAILECPSSLSGELTNDGVFSI